MSEMYMGKLAFLIIVSLFLYTDARKVLASRPGECSGLSTALNEGWKCQENQALQPLDIKHGTTGK